MVPKKLKQEELRLKAKSQRKVLSSVVRAWLEIPGVPRKKILDALENLKRGEDLEKHMIGGCNMALVLKAIEQTKNSKKKRSIARTTARRRKQGDFFTDE